MFLTHESYIKEGECPICSRNVRKSLRKKMAHDSNSQYASEIASEHTAGAGGKISLPDNFSAI